MKYGADYFVSRNPACAGAFHHNLFAILARYCRPGARYLDVGAGMGYLSEWLARRGQGSVTAADISPYALARVAELGLGIHTKLLDVGATKDFGGPYDVIFMIHCLEHLEQPAVALRTLRDQLAPGGQIVVVVPNCGWHYRRLLGDRIWGHNDPTHLQFFTARSLQHLLASVFSDARVFTYPVPALWELSPRLARFLSFGWGLHLIAVGRR